MQHLDLEQIWWSGKTSIFVNLYSKDSHFNGFTAYFFWTIFLDNFLHINIDWSIIIESSANELKKN